MIADALLSRLDGVRPTGQDQWVARCPAHNDKDPSLSIAEKDDRVLIHLFPPRQDREKPVKRRPDYKGMWILSKHAFWVLVIAAADLEQNKPLNEKDMESVRIARARIFDVLEVLDVNA
jgi:hypothetical protein